MSLIFLRTGAVLLWIDIDLMPIQIRIEFQFDADLDPDPDQDQQILPYKFYTCWKIIFFYF